MTCGNAARAGMEVGAMSVAVPDSVIQSALALIPPLFGESWVVGRSGHGGDVSWVQAVIPRGSVSTPDHVLLFHRGVYVGTATEAPVPYTRVLDVADGHGEVPVDYRGGTVGRSGWCGHSSLSGERTGCGPNRPAAVVERRWPLRSRRGLNAGQRTGCAALFRGAVAYVDAVTPTNWHRTSIRSAVERWHRQAVRAADRQ